MKVPPYHWWRTVFFLIPAITLYTIVLGTLSVGSSLFSSRGYFAHWCARTWSSLILKTTSVRVRVDGLDRLEPGRTYVFVSNHQSIYDIPVLFWALPFQSAVTTRGPGETSCFPRCTPSNHALAGLRPARSITSASV